MLHPDREDPYDSQSPDKSAERLIEAADLLLEAAARRPDGLPLAELCGGEASFMPENDFTSEELIEAMMFLFRLGLAEPRPSPRLKER